MAGNFYWHNGRWCDCGSCGEVHTSWPWYVIVVVVALGLWVTALVLAALGLI